MRHAGASEPQGRLKRLRPEAMALNLGERQSSGVRRAGTQGSGVSFTATVTGHDQNRGAPLRAAYRIRTAYDEVRQTGRLRCGYPLPLFVPAHDDLAHPEAQARPLDDPVDPVGNPQKKIVRVIPKH